MPEDLLELASHQQIEQLFRATQLYVGFHSHRIAPLHQGIQELVKPDRVSLGMAVSEVLPRQELLHGEMGSHLDQVYEGELTEPLGVAADDDLFRVQDLAGLVDVCPGFLG